MSLSANDNSGALRAPSGKTPPPPAPSAAYAKRARELHGGGSSTPDAASPIGTGGRYRPPALRAMGSGDLSLESSSPSLVEQSTLPPSNYGPGFRRARAGTLPSNVQLAAQRFAATSNTLSGMSDSVDSFSDQLHNNQISQQQQQPIQQQQPTGRPHSQSIAGLTAPPARPNLRHAQSIAAPAGGLSERNSRLRSGSLTLPAAPALKNLSNAFGSSVFSSNWLGAGQGGSGGLSTIESMGSMDHDEFDPHAPVHTTLDYLGLDDGHRTATLSELRAQTQAALTNNIAPQSRMRASTVSNHYPRMHGASALLPTGGADDEDDLNLYEEFQQPSQPSYGRPRAESHAGLLGGEGYYPSSSASRGGYQQDGLLAPTQATNRPRAISVGILDDPAGRTLQHRSSMADQLNNVYMNDYNQPQYSQTGLNTSGGILKSDNKVLNHRPSVHFPQEEMDMRAQQTYLVAPHSQGRSISPTKVEPASSQIQTPTRSLWIGNLDSSVTSEQLIHVFAPYGAIESLRLLPEKECGFVNFVDMADAIRAKDDVLNRLGGNIGMPNGQTVRIGFGKADSAPVAPAKGINVTSPGPNTPVAGVGKGVGTASIGGIESQLQSSPTRALWIGSIPSTTTPAAILSVFSPYGPIESARVLTHKNCGFINFERLDDAVRARKALNGRDILGPDVGAIRIGFAKVPVKNGAENPNGEDAPPVAVGVGDLSVGATIHALRSVKGASTIPAEQQVLGGGVENYRSNLLLSMISSGQHSASFIMDGMTKQQARAPSVTEQMMIMKELSGGGPDAEADILALADFRPPTMYYTSLPLITERPTGRRWDASKLRELRKRMDTNIMTQDEIDQLATEFLDGEIVELASDWLGNTVVQKLFERCSPGPRFAMLERLCPHVAMIGIHKNGTWAAQKIIECVQTPEEIALVCQNLRPYGPPLLLDQFGNYVIQCCLRFGPPHNDFIFDAMVDRLWEIAQGRFGARSMRACLESAQITVSQQRRVATAIILNSIPLATNPNGALLLTWLLDTSGFPSRYKLLAPRFGPHLSHLCTHKLASLTVLRIINQKVEPEACSQIVEALFNSPNDHVLTDVLGDQVNGVAVVHKILTSPFLDPMQRPKYLEATKRVIIELKVIATQAYRRLIEEVGLPIPQFSASYPPNGQPPAQPKPPMKQSTSHGVPGLPSGYPSTDQGLASMMAALQMGGQNPHSGPPHLQIDPSFRPGQQTPTRSRPQPYTGTFSPASDPFNPFGARSPDMGMPRAPVPHRQNSSGPGAPPGMHPSASYGTPSPSLGQIGSMLGMDAQQGYPSPQQSQMSPHAYQPYMYQQMYHQQSPPMGQYPQ